MIRTSLIVAAVAALAACTPPEADTPAATDAGVDAAAATSDAAVTPASVRAMIESTSPSEAVATLWDEGGGAGWNTVSDGIMNGEQAWLDLVPMLESGVDGGAGMSLYVSLSNGLKVNPAGVLAAADNLGSTCINADAEYMEDREAAVTSNAAYYPAAIAAVEGVTDPALAAQREECLTSLRAGQAAAAG